MRIWISKGDWISSLPTYYPAIKECVDGRSRVEAVVFAAIKSLLATPPPMEPCYRPQAVLDEQGTRLGWIALKGC
jgi:hypothetical protein